MMIDGRPVGVVAITSAIQADGRAIVNAGAVGKLCTNSG
jgi:hypothetical protein